MDRVGPFRPPVELELGPLPRGFEPATYAAAGVVLAVITAQVLLARTLEPMARWRAERMADIELRCLSELALTTEWRWGVPVATAALLGAMLGMLRVQRPAAYLAVAGAGAAVGFLTFVWATAPF